MAIKQRDGPLAGINYPNKNPTPPKSAPDVHGFNLLVPNYNLQRPRWIENKTWWRWDFVLRWRKAIQYDLGSILRMLRMKTQIPNINVVRSVWRRAKKPIKVSDLQPVKDVKGGGGVTGKSKPTTGGIGGH